MLRSGSTLLAAALAAADGVVTVGESHMLWAALADGRPCTCGEPIATCPFWKPILASVLAEYGLGVESARELHQKVLSLVRIRRVPWLLGGFSERRQLSADETLFAKLAASIYRAVADATNARIIVDASKTPAFPALMGSAGGVRFGGIHLIRDPRAVAYSEHYRFHRNMPEPLRAPSRTSWKSAMWWSIYNLGTEWTARHQQATTPWTRVRYEDFVAAPEKVLTNISLDLGLDIDAWPFDSPDVIQLGVSHEPSGNPSRFETKLRTIALRSEWVTALPARQRRIVNAITWPQLRRYHYPLRGGPVGYNPSSGAKNLPV
jgi:hypothetical protein